MRFLAGYFDASTGEQHQGQHSGNRWQWHQDYGYWYGSHGEGGKKTPLLSHFYTKNVSLYQDRLGTNIGTS